MDAQFVEARIFEILTEVQKVLGGLEDSVNNRFESILNQNTAMKQMQSQQEQALKQLKADTTK